MQVGGDGKTACASCHFQAGADNRTVNTLAPGASTNFRGANYQLSASDFPFHRLRDNNFAESQSNPVVYDTAEIVGSQGVVKRNFVSIVEGAAADQAVTVSDPVFNLNGVNTRQVTGRNTPSVINAVFNNRNFWDGRANRFFNGVNPFGEMDKNASIWAYDGANGLRKVQILLDNASLASQAVGPANNSVEMSYNGRTFPELGRKLLSLPPLCDQTVHPQDSVLGSLAATNGPGLQDGVTYAGLIRRSFDRKWWGSPDPTSDGYTQMEANLSLFWGMSIMLYESTLVSDQTPFDRYLLGDSNALSKQQKEGLKLFMGAGKCINCHSGSELTSASVSYQRSRTSPQSVHLMPMAVGPSAFYDEGFYNIGVRKTAEDLGIGGKSPFGGPLSLSRRIQQGENPDLAGQSVSIGPNDPIAVDGSFKTPGLRNVELTGPYFHNGGRRTLKEVVQFYARGTDFGKANRPNTAPDVDGIEEIQGDDRAMDALVSFLKSLTDERVRYQKAPFDHPELRIPNGHSSVESNVAIDNMVTLPAVGRDGGAPLKPFDVTLP